MSAENYR